MHAPGVAGQPGAAVSAFAPVKGTEVAAAAGTGGEEDETSGGEAAAPAGAAPADVQDSVDWLRSVASDAVAARTAYVSRTKAQDEATAALSRKHGIWLHISSFACREKVELAHVSAFDAALSETAKSTVRHLRRLTLILLEETERVPEGGVGAYRTSATYSSDAERRAGRAYMLERNHSDEVFLHLALSSSAADYAASLSAIAAALPTVTRGVAAAAADAEACDELRRQAAKVLQLTFVFSFWISPDNSSETRHHVADFCRAVVAHPAPPRRRHVPVGVRVKAAISPTEQGGVPYPLTWHNASGAQQIALHPRCDILLVAHDVDPGALHDFLAQHGARVIELQDEHLAPERAVEAARTSAATALSFEFVLVCCTLPSAQALQGLQRLCAAATTLQATLRSADPRWRGWGRVGPMRMVADTDAAAYSVEADGMLVVPVAFFELRLRQLLLTAAPGAPSPPLPPSPLPGPPPPPPEPRQPAPPQPKPTEDPLPQTSPPPPAPSAQQQPQNAQAEAVSDGLREAVVSEAPCGGGGVLGILDGLRWIWDTFHRR